MVIAEGRGGCCWWLVNEVEVAANILQGPGCPSPTDCSLAPNVNRAPFEEPSYIARKAKERKAKEGSR